MPVRPYPVDDSEEQEHVSEPAAIYSLPQDAASIKLEAIDELMNIFDAERLSKALSYLRTLVKEEGNIPCQYTSDELRQRVRIAMEQSRRGLGVSSEDMRKRKPTWE